jgi:hypothetical protein
MVTAPERDGGLMARAEPIRTCVGCRARDLRTRLARVVVEQGVLCVDRTRRAPGRGGYLHARRACLEAFARKGGFVRSLRCVIPRAEREMLRDRFAEEQS